MPPTCDHIVKTQGGRLFRCDLPPRHASGRHWFVRVPPQEPPADPEEVLESKLEEYFLDAVRRAGGQTVKLTPPPIGIPDRLVFMRGGHTFLVELKTDTGTVDPKQKLWHRRILDQEVHVHVVYGKRGITRWINDVKIAVAPDNNDTAPSFWG